MTRKHLVEQIFSKKTFLCIGLDTDLEKMPKHLLEQDDAVFNFNKAIIDNTAQFCVSYKINTAFYEARGLQGWQEMEKTAKYLAANFPDHFLIADAKRGDIGNTSDQYAKAFFTQLPFHSVTVAPYMGSDSVQPFLKYKDKWVIILALTSNQGAFDFQTIQTENGAKVYEEVLKTCSNWGSSENTMYVCGATKAEMLSDIRKIVPDHFLLVPGVGAQGGSLQEVCKFGWNTECGLLINSSRAIIYASGREDFAEAARAEALKVQQEMAQILASKTAAV